MKRKTYGLVVFVLLLGSFSVPLLSQGGVSVTVTLTAGDHTVAIGAIAFTRHNEEGELVMDFFAFDDPTFQQFKCQPGEVKSMTFEVPQVPNDLEIIYTSDGGPPTPYTIPTDRFEFGKEYTLPSPSPGPKQEPPPGDPPGDALIRVELGPIGISGIYATYIFRHQAMEVNIQVVDEDYSGEIYSIDIIPEVQDPSWETVEGIEAPENWTFEKIGNGVRFYTETDPLLKGQHKKFRFTVKAKRISWYIRVYAGNQSHLIVGMVLGKRQMLQLLV